MLLLLFILMWNDLENVLATQGCGSVVNNTLTSPGYPNDYPSNMHCVYTVPIPSGMALKIKFQDFHLEPDPSLLCLYDYLEISDENDANIGKFCYKEKGKEVVAGGDHVVITFRSDNSVQERGFLLFFSATKPTLPRIIHPVPGTVMRALAGRKMLRCNATGTLPIYIALMWKSTILENSTNTAEFRLFEEGNYSCVATNKYGTDTRVILFIVIGCDSVINNTLISPRYPIDYPSNMYCVYTVPIPDGMALKITFQDFILQDGYLGLCIYDYLKISITDGNNLEIGKYCGELTGKQVLVGGKDAMITFRSDYLFEKRGFKLVFTAFQPTSPKLELPDPAPEVRAVAGHSLLRCSASGTPPIYTALIMNSTVLVNTSNTASVTLLKEGNYSCVATSKYGTDTRVIPVIIIGCGSVENNTLKTPEYPKNYPGNMHCVYNVPIPDGMALKINFHEFYLEKDFSCNDDYLKIKDDQNVVVGKYCGELTGKFIFVYGDYAQITFHSDTTVQERGFLITFTAIQSNCRPHCSLSWSLWYGNSLVCRNVTSLVRIIPCAPTILKKMDLSLNAIKIVPKDIFANLSGLVELYLSSNAIQRLPKGLFANLRNLKILDLSSNSITFLPESLFSNMSKLIRLSLPSNAITMLHEGVFANQKNLFKLNMSSNDISVLPEGVFASLSSLRELDLSSNAIALLPERVFGNQKRLYSLDLSSNAFTLLPERVFANLTFLRVLLLSSNAITLLPEKVFSKMISLSYLDLSSNAIKVLPEGVFVNQAVELGHLDLSSNAITVVPKGVFRNMTILLNLDLSSNAVTALPDGMFDHLVDLNFLYLQNNKISQISNRTFAKTTKLKYLFLSGNNLEVIPRGAFFNVDLSWTGELTLMLSDNPITTIESEVLRKPHHPNLILLIKNRTPRTLKYSSDSLDQYDCVIYLNPDESRSEAIKVEKNSIESKEKKQLISAILAQGFIQTHKTDETLYFEPCPLGTFSNSTYQGTEGCTPCPPGRFYSDDVGYVSTSCKKCPNGSFVAFEKAPGKQVQDCKTCPLGTESDFFAGYRACMCLEGHYRTHMLERCHRCGIGFKCQNDYASLKSGYWWSWRNKTHKDRYRVFISNLLTSSPALGEDDLQYPYSLPTPFKCPEKTACQGGIDSTCKDGYKGPLCSVCKTGYYKQFHQCKQCPSKMLMGGQLLMIAAIFIIITAVCVWTTKRKANEREHTLTDSFLSKIKIAIGFYQVTYGLLEAFSYINWPDSLQIISKYSQVLQLNILEMAPVHCLFPGLHVDAFGHLFAIMAINVALIGVSCVLYGVVKIIISQNDNLVDEEKSLKVSQTKELVYRNLFFFLYVTYLSTCSKTATVLPLSCWDLCRDKNEQLCSKYLKADNSIRCHSPWYNKLVIVAYLSTAYIIALPTATLIVLWRQRRVILSTEDAEASENTVPGTELIKGLHFLYKNYKPRSWYWELIEISRKVIVTSGLILVGQESRSYIGLAWTIAGMYGIFFAWHRPTEDVFENRLMTTSIAATIFNLGVGAVSKIPAENLPASTDLHMDSTMFNILVLGANTLVIGLLAFQYLIHIYEYLKEWRKNPQWSFSCCLALILPLVSLPGEINGLVGKNITGQQLKDGNIEMSTIVGTLKDSGAIDVTVEEGERPDFDPTEARNGNCDHTQANNGEKEIPNDAVAMQRSESIGDTLEDDEQGDNTHTKVQHAHSRDVKYSCTSSKQGTQTNLSTIFPVTDVLVHGSVKKKDL